MPCRHIIALLLSLFCTLAGPAAAQQAGGAAPVGGVSFRHDIWPVLKRHCWSCHSGSEPGGGLSMDNVASLAKGGESGAALAAGKPDESLLVQVLTGAAEPAMPKDRPRLPAAKIEILRQWILAGAADDSAAAAPEVSVVIPAVYRHAPAVTSLAFSQDGQRLAAACRSEVVIVDAAADAQPRRLPTESDLLTLVDFSPDGATLVAVGGTPGRYGEVRFFNSADGTLRQAGRLGLDTLFRGGFSPNGALLALGGSDGSIYVLPVPAMGVAPAATGAGGPPVLQEGVRRFDRHSDWVADVCFSLDGRLLISVGRDKSVKVSELATGNLVRSIAASAEMVNSVAATATSAISAGRDRVPATYDLKLALGDSVFAGVVDGAKPADQAAQYTRQMEGQPGEVLDLATNADRSLLAVAGNFSEVRIYKTADNSRAATITAVPAPVYCVALSPDGARLATGSRNGQIGLYEVASGKLLKSISPVPVEVAGK